MSRGGAKTRRQFIMSQPTRKRGGTLKVDAVPLLLSPTSVSIVLRFSTFVFKGIFFISIAALEHKSHTPILDPIMICYKSRDTFPSTHLFRSCSQFSSTLYKVVRYYGWKADRYPRLYDLDNARQERQLRE